MALEDFCAACTYMGESADSYGKYYCDRKGERHLACDPKCYNFCEAYRRSDSARKNMYENSRNHSSGGCYLTTAMCNILDYTDNNYYLQTLRKFRDTVLKTNVKYWPLLVTYDTIGPIIAKNLIKDIDDYEIAETLFKTYIKQAVLAIEEEKYETAINIYIAMTNTLAERYNIDLNVVEINPEEIDIESLGHGKTKTKIYRRPKQKIHA